MDIEPFLGKSKPLSQWISVCIEEPGQQYWLLYETPKSGVELTLSTEMFPVTGDTGDMSDEEYEDFDSSVHTCGYCNFLNLDQLEDIVNNLSIQKKHYSKADMLDAINYYFSHDAFINIASG